MYTQIENGKAKYPAASLEYLVTQNVIESVDATQAELTAANVVPVTALVGQAPIDGRLYTAEIVQQPDGSWAQELVQVQISDQHYQSNVSLQAQAVKADRTRMLTDCDWTQMPDVNLSNTSKAAWAAFRQALRDIPNQSGFPFNVTWPSPPQ
jgi:hypothetical protein